MITTIETVETSDATLVADSLKGKREAFSQIVARYQTLICSLAYSGTGSLSQSEDLAQDTFIAAWKQLGTLREPPKLRSWLCGIARNLIHDALKKMGREPSHAAESLEALHEAPAPEPTPHDLAMSKEEEAILWRSIGQIPEIYREPLILFYREHQSIETVAANLDLSEDAVKQRLSRGRKLLQEQVLAFVEGALGRTNPGQAYTLSVMAALPGLTLSVKAAALGTVVAKGGAGAKAVGIMGLLGALLSPLLGFFGMWVGYRVTMESARSDREREFNKAFYRRLVGCIVGFFLLYGVLIFFGGSLAKTNSALFASLAIGLALAYVAAIVCYSVWCYHARKRLIADLTVAERATKPETAVWEYRSRFQLFGLPFIHLRVGDRLGEPLRAWIAIGDCAFGVLFAFGGLAVAPVSLGGCAVGLISFGGVSIGALALGGMALGGWSFGGMAVGWQAFGGCAVAWNAAWGGYAVAHDLALGGVAHATQVNSEAVQQLLNTNLFFRISNRVLPHLFLMNALWLIPLIIQRQVMKFKLRQQKTLSDGSHSC